MKGGLGSIGITVGPIVYQGVCRSFVHGFYLWGITLRVDPRATARLLARLGAAVDDHDAYKEMVS